MLQHRIDQQIRVEEEEEEEEDEEIEMEVEAKADKAILEIMKINQISKTKVDVQIINLINPG